MGRPFPVYPHGPRRSRARQPALLLACPRLSPQWELGALQVLMKPKPHLKDAIAHRNGDQAWPKDARDRVELALGRVEAALGYRPVVHFPQAGDFLFVAEVAQRDALAARATAIVLSHHLPGLWFTFDRLFIRNGHFFRRQFGYKLNLVPATNIHLPRDIRAALRGAFPCKPSPSSPKRSRPAPAAK